MMATLLADETILTFQNTGREHPNTLDFLNELQYALERPIVWLEFRPPKKRGAPPREFEFAIVNYATADRSGGPFEACLGALAAYREMHKGLGPIAPWAKSRICTAYLKRRVQEHYAHSLGLETYDSYVGLRADEPERVYRLRDRDTQAKAFRTPLFDVGVTKADVNAFWSEQAFDLQLSDYQGNCTACFLKDQGDIARVLGEDETEAEWWKRIKKRFPNFGGQNFPGYAQLDVERPVRLDIERALRAGDEPEDDGVLDPRRFRLVVLQEKRRLKGERAAFSCSCEPSVALADDENDSILEGRMP